MSAVTSSAGGTQPPGFVHSFDWRCPNYDLVIAERTERLRTLRARPELLPSLREYYREHPAQFISDWGMTYDPRNVERGLAATTPFVLFPRQVELVEWIVERWKNQEPGIVEKSRDVGASWLLVALFCTLCLFHNGLSLGIASRKEELVDRSGDPSCLFFKARMFLGGLPVEFRGGWDARSHTAHMRLTIPSTGSTLTGEAGDNVGRGARHGLVGFDEAAHMERAELIDAALSATTNCRIDLSSVNGMQNSFARRRHSGRIKVFTFRWTDDPRKDRAWYEKKCAELDPVIVASEIDLNYSASVEGLLIPSAWVQAAIGAHTRLGIEPSGQRYAGLDVADAGRDDCAFAARHGVYLHALHRWSGKNSDIFATTVKAFALCDELNLESFYFDSDGLGSGVRGDARILNERRDAELRPIINVEPFRGSSGPCDPDSEMVPSRANKDFFANLKAQSWWALRLRFQTTFRAMQGLPYFADDIISIDPKLPHLSELLMQLSQPTYSLNSVGKVVVDKVGDGQKSPDLADAVCIAFNPSSSNLELWVRLASDEDRVMLNQGGIF